MNVERFRLQYPEFGQTDQTLVQAKLNKATAYMGGPNVRIWGTYATDDQPINQADLAQAALAAHYLATSPFGTETRMQEDGEEKTRYYKEFEDLMYARSGGVTVSGRGVPGFTFPRVF